MGTQNGPKIIVKVVIGPFKDPKLPCHGSDSLDPKRPNKLIISIVII